MVGLLMRGRRCAKPARTRPGVISAGGTAGCLASITEAMNYLDYNNDVINVAAGTYFENGFSIGTPVQIH